MTLSPKSMAATFTIATDFTEHSSIHSSKVTTIKSLSESGLTSLPPSFACKNLHKIPVLDSSSEYNTLPVVDFSLLVSGNSEQRDKAIQDLGQACEEWGFFFLINHGIPENLINSMMEGVKGFFNLSEEEKKEFQGKHIFDPIRYGSSINTAVEKIHCWRDFLKVFVHPEFHFPHKPSGFSDTAFEYLKMIREIIRELLRGLSENLGLEPNYINKATTIESSFQVFVANLYPPCPEPELAVGLHPHSDHGLLTVLTESISGGLQTLHNGKWVKVNAPPNALMVNTADQLEIMSNGKYKSNVHRAVVHSNATRISMVTANGPSLDQLISPATEFVSDTHPPAYTSVTYKKYYELSQSNSFDNGLFLDRMRI
ncbi:2-oxoglutarate-dependent dioxygenase 19-like [Prosopis cineraria]|uniref:2-oxoglutarate-dependent dioxygenase 19-like n=1 Tax=Prosopis cineraria TaxID=364024 RepID=UPI00240FACD9|nr:2-oxoglutarate-dependent dioxygenase 19-like [Prosopis cineraria]